MRIDKFLQAVNLTKRRAVANDMCECGAVELNGARVKPGREVRVGDVIKIKLNSGEQNYEILAIPVMKNTPKSQQENFIKKL